MFRPVLLVNVAAQANRRAVAKSVNPNALLSHCPHTLANLQGEINERKQRCGGDGEHHRVGR
jgi:hypothetical protein